MSDEFLERYGCVLAMLLSVLWWLLVLVVAVALWRRL